MDFRYPRFMQKPFVTQAEIFVSSSDLLHPALHALDDTEAVLDWSKTEPILSSIYVSQTGRPSYPLLTLFRGLLLGVWYRLSEVQLSQCLCRDLLFRKFCHLELGVMSQRYLHLDGFSINWLNTICGNTFWERSTANLKPRASF